MLSQITIENFKSYRSAVLKLAPLTLLIGANASGKSNAIEAIRFLSWLAQGRRLDDISQSVRETDIHIRGTHRDVLFDQATSNLVKLGCSLSNSGDWKDFLITLQINPDDIRVFDEEVKSDGTTVPLYYIKERSSQYSHEVQVAYNNFARGGRKPTIACKDTQAIFTQLDIPSRFKNPKSRKIIPDTVLRLQETLRKILFLDPIPRHMVDYSFIVDHQLKGDGENLSSTLYDLCIRQNRKDDVLTFIRKLPEQDIVDISFIETPRSEVMVQLVESFGGRRVTREAPLLSDGTLRVLAIAAALLSSSSGSLIIIEEIDNGIHPSRADMMLKNVLNIAQERNLRVLLTSHNPALLDTLPYSAIPNVVACFRETTSGSSQLVRLEDLYEYSSLISRGPLGQLMTNKVLDRYLKEQRDATTKKRDSLAWIKTLKLQQ